MTDDPDEILLVEDNPDDLELALYAFKKRKVASPVRVARDGEEALSFIFGGGEGASGPVRRPRGAAWCRTETRAFRCLSGTTESL